MATTRASLADLAQRILAAPAERELLDKLCLELRDFFYELSPIRASTTAPRYQALAQVRQGQALSPEAAAVCLLDPFRTISFISSVHDAIEKSLARFGRPIHLLYAGTGPYAPLVLPLLPLFSPNDVQVTFSDRFPDSVASVKRIAEHLKLTPYFKQLHLGDVVDLEINEPLHVFVVETLRQGLEMEPQLALARAHAPKLVPGGFMIPEEVNVSAVMLDTPAYFVGKAGINFAASRCELGNLITLTCGNLSAIEANIHVGTDGRERYVADPIKVPILDLPETSEIVLLLELRSHGKIMIPESQSGLTVPLMCRHFPNPKAGDTLNYSLNFTNWPRWEYR